MNILNRGVNHGITNYAFDYCNGIAEKLSIRDKTCLLGGVAPNAVRSKEEKETSHFYAGTTKNYTRRIDYDSFFHKYGSYMDSLYFRVLHTPY